jgi:conjugative relaxase-like TrwC/TraI family protein
MLKANKLGGGTQDRGNARLAHYFDETKPETTPNKAADDYYIAAKDSRVPAQWWCPGGTLQTDGAAIGEGELKRAMDGFDRDGTKLVRTGTKNARVAGWDLQLSVPKPLSALWALSDPEIRREIVGDVIASARDTFAELHRSGAFVTRRGAGGKIHEAAKDVAIAIVPHATSRAADPHIHLHCILVNSCRRMDGKGGAIHSPDVFAKNEGGAITAGFLDRLTAKMTDRGMTIINRNATGFDVEGVPKELVRQWSSRRQTILAAVAEARTQPLTVRGRGAQKDRIAKETRKAKTTIPVGPALESRWRQQVQRLGISPARVWQRVLERATLARRQIVSFAALAADKLKQANILRMRQ